MSPDSEQTVVPSSSAPAKGNAHDGALSLEGVRVAREPKVVPSSSAPAKGNAHDGALSLEGISVAREPTEVSDEDRRTLRTQLGREARGVVEIAARCVCGRPLVVKTAPRLPDGAPFPTTFYLTHPQASSAIGTLEAGGVMAEMAARLASDGALAEAYRAAHLDYLARRAELGAVPEIADISAGGMPTRVKCLHALAAHALAAGPGVNPLGDETLLRLAPHWRPDRCVCADR